jgi:hypothetical protein
MARSSRVTLIDHQLDRSHSSGHDSFMSASDAAPLPRLGEVFFDVRGNSRSMRLSWYADTDVAVFSIWQGGKCTGTFRLPMGDLNRMIEILQRGPERRHGRGAAVGGVGEHGVGDQRGAGYGDSGYDADYNADYKGEYDADYTVAHNAGAHKGPVSEADYESGTYSPGGAHGPGEYGTGEYGGGQYGTADYGGGEYDAGEYGGADYRSGGYVPGEYAAGDYGSGDYGRGEHSSRDFGPGDHGQPRHRDGAASTRGNGAERYGRADSGRPDFEQAQHAPRPAYRHDGDRYQADVTGQRSVPAGEAGYGQQRYEPHYLRPQPDSEPGYLDDPDYRLPADPAARSRHSMGRHSGGQPP